MGKNETKNYVGGSGMDDMELDERDIQLMEESRKEGKKKLFISPLLSLLTRSHQVL